MRQRSVHADRTAIGPMTIKPETNKPKQDDSLRRVGRNDHMPMLTNARHEKVARGLAKGMSADAAHTAAEGCKPNLANAARMNAKEPIQDRMAELHDSTADQITDLRDFARQHTRAAIETLVSVMEDPKSPAAARVAAAQGLLDRGYGKPTRHIEAEIGVYDSLSLAEQQALLAVLDALDVDDDVEATRH